MPIENDWKEARKYISQEKTIQRKKEEILSNTNFKQKCENTQFKSKTKFRIDIQRVISKENRYEILRRQKWKCNFCGVTLKYNKGNNWQGKVAHIDHIHPFSKRNSYINEEHNINELSNLQALCPKCNLGKTDKEIN